MELNGFLFPRTTNFNNIRQSDHCYRTWKDLKYARKNVIPSNSRPLLNNSVTTNCSILHNNIQNNNIISNPHNRYIGSRHPSALRTKCNDSYKDGNFVKAKPNPIKHWRKQLFPSQGTATRSRNSAGSIEQVMSGPLLYRVSVKCLSIMQAPRATEAKAICGPIE